MTDSQRNADAGQRAETVMVELSHARMRLMELWLVFASLIFLIVIAQSAAHKYEIPGEDRTRAADTSGSAPADPSNTPGLDRSADVWKWLLPNLMPTLTAMVSAVAATWSLQRDDMSVRRDFFRFAFTLSFFYLGMLLALILCQPFVNPFNMNAQVKSLQNSNLGLGPIQGLVAAAVGVLFVSAKSGPTGGSKAEDLTGDVSEQASS